MSHFSRKSFFQSKLIVIKVGTSSLTDNSGKLDPSSFQKIAGEIAQVGLNAGKKAILVTSGAVAAGRDKLGSSKLSTVQEKQAAAAVGQSILMQEYERAFVAFGLIPAQVLLTRDAISNRTRYLHARNTIDQILKIGAVPVINENDTVSAEEIRFGDNDTLSGLVATLMGADLLIMLSDVEGFIKNGKVLSLIEKITGEIEECAGMSSTSCGTGGMITKISAAKLALAAGIPAVIADFRKENVIEKILSGEEIGTVFVPKPAKVEGKKRWLMSGKKPLGKVAVDSGAIKALIEQGKSLLPVGIKETKGKFLHGDIISITDLSGHEIGRGITSYSSDEVLKIKGKNSKEAKDILGVLPCDEVVHRDNMVII
ncbi:MAG: glutamate 5-kinase [Candidatus Margulisiibacteriota bacterium]